MSAIWGAIDLGGKAISDNVKELLSKGFEGCVIDRREFLSEENVYFACGIQYITPESKYEKAPSKDEKDYYFVTDAILDNREEVCQKLGINNQNDLPDGEIIRQAFSKLGVDSLTLMRGAYTFVGYDSVRKSIDIVSDAAGNRFVYYTFLGDVFLFSSLMKPLELFLNTRKLNKTWVSDFIGNDGLSVFETCEDTSLEAINRIAPATYMTISSDKYITRHLYWDVMSFKHQPKTKTDKEYKQEFLELYKSCVKDVLRADGETAIFLSSGYDSTSVACLAAPMLKEQGKKLYSFTSVPDADYVSDYSEHNAPDESDIVKKTAEFLGNLDATFLGLEGVDLWEARKDYMDICEIPYKSPENMLWLFEGHKKAREKGARIILSGAFGNGTVSFDNCLQYLIWLVKHLKVRTYLYELEGLKRRYGANKKAVTKLVIKGLFNKWEGTRGSQSYEKSYIDRNFLISSGVKKRIDKVDDYFRRGYYNAQRYHDSFLPIENFRHYGEFPQKHSLYSGVVLRDPTRDIRLVEFVRKLPHDQFFHNGYKRRLIRDYCKEFMPTDYFVDHPVGVQSADIKFRFVQRKDKIVKEWLSIIEKSDSKGALDTQKLYEDLKSKDLSEFQYFDIIRLFYTMNLLEYMQNCEM